MKQGHELICAADLIREIPKPRPWVVEGWIPDVSVTGVFGPGGGGKSLLMQQLATCVAAPSQKDGNKRSFLGLPTMEGPVVGYFCEDDKDELNRRQNAINNELGIDGNTLTNLFVCSRVGKNNMLGKFTGGNFEPDDFPFEIITHARRRNAAVIILDNVAQMFPGNENSRAEVTMFVNFLHQMARLAGAAIILIGHPSKGATSEYSGSTAWDACFRSRLYLGRPQASEDNAHDDDGQNMRMLYKSKSNYSRIGDEVVLRWKDGAFEALSGTVIDVTDRLKAQQTERQVQEMFLHLLDRYAKQGRNLSHSPKATNYAPKTMAKDSDNGNFTKRQFEKAMDQLFTGNRIVANTQIGARPSNRTALKGITPRRQVFLPLPHRMSIRGRAVNGEVKMAKWAITSIISRIMFDWIDLSLSTGRKR